MTRKTHHMRKLVCLVMLVASMPGFSGCSRSFWRRDADEAAYTTISEHITDPRWAVPRFDVTPDPRSRFFDPFDPDCAPLPPDDPAAHRYMHWVDGWEGYKGWHKFGNLISVENPQWLEQFGMTPEMIDPDTGEYIAPVPAIENVTLRDAIELNLIHNREYQTRLEDVYLAALDVAFERFQFGVRYLNAGGREPGTGVDLDFVPHGPGDNALYNFNFGVSQLLPAGTQWAVELTNNTLWLFSGGTSSASVLSYSITQPLLAGAGRKVGLEGLTLAERQLLYAIRDLARFRKTNFSSVVVGSTGFLNLLQQVQSIRNEVGNIARLEEQVERLLSEAAQNTRSAGADLETLPAGVVFPPEVSDQVTFRDDLGRLLWTRPDDPRAPTISDEQIDILRGLSDDPDYLDAINEIVQSLRTEVGTLDVLQLQSDLQDSRNRLRIQRTNLQSAYDRTKISYGLPPDMSFSISDKLLKPFEVIDPKLTVIEEDLKDFIDLMLDIDPENPPQERLEEVLGQFGELLEQVEKGSINVVESDYQRLRRILEEKVESMPADMGAQLESDMRRSTVLFEKAKTDFNKYKRAFEGLERMLEGMDDVETRQEIDKGIKLLREDVIRLVQSLQVVQVSYRVELIQLIPFQMSIQAAVGIGLENRLDLMNSRAEVMDARRAVEVIANRLRGGLNVVGAGEFRNSGGNKPFDFRGELSDLRLGVQFTTPLDQIDERNTYRAALINYQRAKRSYMEMEDQVKLQIRNSWRELLGARSSLEISRRAVRLAALRYDSAVSEANRPRGPNEAGSSGVSGRNLTDALNSILRAQNQLIGFWVDYETNRINIHRDMGIMEIGPDGVWEDEYYRKLSNPETQYEDFLIPQEPVGPDEPVGQPGGLDLTDYAGSGRSRLGDGMGDSGVVELDAGVQLINWETDKSDHRESFPWAVSD